MIFPGIKMPEPTLPEGVEFKKFIRITNPLAAPMTKEVADVNHIPHMKSDEQDGYVIVVNQPNTKFKWMWCPKSLWDKESVEVKNEVLAATAPQMVSPNYKERFKAEVYQLKNRLEGLKSMLINWDAGKLNFKPTCPRDLYDVQIKAMEDYLNVLMSRAKLENVEF